MNNEASNTFSSILLLAGGNATLRMDDIAYNAIQTGVSRESIASVAKMITDISLSPQVTLDIRKLFANKAIPALKAEAMRI